MNFLRHNLKHKNKGIGFTLAASYNEETTMMNFGVSKCCKHDQFTKRVGRKIAQQRSNQPTYSLRVPIESNLTQFFNNEFETLKSILKNKNIHELKSIKNSTILREPSFEINFN